VTRKLYVRNPNQLNLGGYRPREAALAKLFGLRKLERMPMLECRRASAAVYLAFERDFTGDRVLAFAFGMRTMLLDAYDGDPEA
jgi:hypothetical protein